MKILDMGKIFGSPISGDSMDIQQMKIILLKRYKDKSNGEKIIAIENVKNPFKISKPSLNIKSLCNFFSVCNSIQSKKIEKGELMVFDYKDKIKSIGNLAINITEINSVDPRFIILWNYNAKIKINLYYKDKLFFSGEQSDFIKEFRALDVSKRETFERLISIIPTKTYGGIKGIGQKKYIKYLKDGIILGGQNQNIDSLLKEIA